jgi:hypothetical protein
MNRALMLACRNYVESRRSLAQMVYGLVNGLNPPNTKSNPFINSFIMCR